MSANQRRIIKSLLRRKATWEMDAEELARVVADHQGWEGRDGGWIYTTSGKPIVQGWSRLADRLVARHVIVVGKGVNWRNLTS